MCSCANFDSGFEKHGSAEWGAAPSDNEDRPKDMNGKMERSFIDFSLHYPSYQPSPQGQTIKENLNKAIVASPLAESMAPGGITHSLAGNSSRGFLSQPMRATQSIDQLSPQEIQMLHQLYHESMLLGQGELYGHETHSHTLW